MNDFFDDRRLVVACIIGIVVVLTISIISITVVWQTNLGGTTSSTSNEVTGESTANIESDIGKYKVVNVSDEAQLKKYAVDLADNLEFGNIDALKEELSSLDAEWINEMFNEFDLGLNDEDKWDEDTEDDVPEVDEEEETIVQQGDIFELQ